MAGHEEQGGRLIAENKESQSEAEEMRGQDNSEYEASVLPFSVAVPSIAGFPCTRGGHGPARLEAQWSVWGCSVAGGFLLPGQAH